MGCSCQGGRAASPLHEPPPPPSLQSPPLWTQGQTGPGGLGRLGSCRKGLRETTRTGQDVPHLKAAPEEDEERERTKISNISVSLERVTGVVTTFPPSPQGAGGTSGTAPCAVPVPVPQGGLILGSPRLLRAGFGLHTCLGLTCPSGTRYGNTWALRRRRRKAAVTALSKAPSSQLSWQTLLHLPHLPPLDNECFVSWDLGWGWGWEGRAQPRDRFPSRGAELARNSQCSEECSEGKAQNSGMQ